MKHDLAMCEPPVIAPFFWICYTVPPWCAHFGPLKLEFYKFERMWKAIFHLKVCCRFGIRWRLFFGLRYLTWCSAVGKNLQNLYKSNIGFVKKHGIEVLKSWSTCKVIQFRLGITLKGDVRYKTEALKSLFHFRFWRWALMEMCWQKNFLFYSSCFFGN